MPGRRRACRAVSCRWVSSWSSRSSCAGPKPATWRAISEPIEPPAPVISTRRPCEQAAHRVEVGLDLLAAEQVVDAEVADVARSDPAADDLLRPAAAPAAATPASSREVGRPADRRRVTRWARRGSPGAASCLRHDAPAGRRRRRRPGRRGRRGRACAGRRRACTTGTSPPRGRGACRGPARPPASPAPRTATREPGAARLSRRLNANRRDWNRMAPSSMVTASGAEDAHRERERPVRQRASATVTRTADVKPAEQHPAGLGDAGVPPDLRVEPGAPRRRPA